MRTHARGGARGAALLLTLTLTLVALAGCGPRPGASTTPGPLERSRLEALDLDLAVAPSAPPEGARVRTLRRAGRAPSSTRPGFVEPYPVEHVSSTFGDCRDNGRRQHQGLDIAGAGPEAGLGAPVRAMARAKIVALAHPDMDPRYGTLDRCEGTVTRRGRTLPCARSVPGYGQVHFFTRRAGRSRTGIMIVTQVIGGPLDGHRLRYMHLGAIHPALSVGDVVEAGQELGLMGGTAVQSSSPHVHIDLETPGGQRVDVAPFLGLPADPTTCRRRR